MLRSRVYLCGCAGRSSTAALTVPCRQEVVSLAGSPEWHGRRETGACSAFAGCTELDLAQVYTAIPMLLDSGMLSSPR
jgi:hypothetical protein